MLKLIRYRISFMVGLSAFAGACLSEPVISSGHLYAVLTAVFLGAGTSALNQYQEREEDAVMKRTSGRPLPSGAIKPSSVLIIAAILIAISMVFALMTGSAYVFALVFITVIFYNFIYTPLKKLTPFALLAGSITGAIPPLLGYTALGGDMFSPDIMTVAAVMYIWQTPHFAMLAEKYSDDYKKAGFKTLSSQYGHRATDMFIKIWNSAFMCSLLFVPLSGVYQYGYMAVIHTAVTVITALMLLRFYRNESRAFHILNLCMVFFFLLLVVDRIII